jgi:predicted nucleic acid-binding protein
MEQNTLTEVLDVERQIKEQLGVERAKAQRWLEQANRETDAATQAELAQLAQSRAAGAQAAKKAAEVKAAAIVQQAQTAAGRIERLDDQYLQAIVWQHIAEIIPGVAK